MKLWEKNVSVNKFVEKFTIGKDRDLDVFLAEADVLGSLAHIKMLHSIKLLTKEELHLLEKELKHIYKGINERGFTIE